MISPRNTQQSLQYELSSMIHLHTIGKYNNMDDVYYHFRMKFIGLLIIITLLLIASVIVALSAPPLLSLFISINTTSLYVLSNVMDATLVLLIYGIIVCHEYGRYKDGYEHEVNGIRSIFVIIRPGLLIAHEDALNHLLNERVQMLSWKNKHTVTIGEIIDFVDEYKKI